MTRQLAARPLHLVHSTSAPADELLAALDQWARATADGEPVAYLEVSDGELRAEFAVTAAGAAQLATAVRSIAARRSGGAASGGTLPSRSRER